MKSPTTAAFDLSIRVTKARSEGDLHEDHLLLVDRLPENRRRAMQV
jgi:hypothetical protein